MFSHSRSLLMHPGQVLRLPRTIYPFVKTTPCSHLSSSSIVHSLPKSYNIPERVVNFVRVPAKIRNAVAEAYPVDERIPLKPKKVYEGYEPLLEATRPFTCRIEMYNRYMNKEYIITSGSGFIFHPEGFIATSSVCIADLPYCYVIMNNGMKYDGRLEWKHEHLGLAVIRINAPNLNLPCMTLSSYKDGQVVAITGVPDREHIPNDPVTRKEPFFPVASALSELEWFDRVYDKEGWTRLGHVGGPIVNRYAEVVGVAGIDDKKDPYGIPVDFLKYYMMKRPIASVIMAPRLFGVLFFELSISFLMDFNLSLRHFNPAKKGVVVVQCAEGCPAHEAGIRVSDVITDVNGRIPRTPDVTDALSLHQDVTMIVNRRGEEIKISMPYDRWPVNEDETWLS